MLRLEDLTLFVRVAAARRRVRPGCSKGRSAPPLSGETALNIRLFARSTRSLYLTPEGEDWLPFAQQMLDTLQKGLEKIRAPDDEVQGTQQISVPSDRGRNLLLSIDAGGFSPLSCPYLCVARPLNANGVMHDVCVHSAFMSDDAEVIRRLAIAGKGIAYKSWLDFSEDVRAGRLNMICPHRQQLSTAVRLLHEAVRVRCQLLLKANL